MALALASVVTMGPGRGGPVARAAPSRIVLELAEPWPTEVRLGKEEVLIRLQDEEPKVTIEVGR
jgi:hypothetical protein